MAKIEKKNAPAYLTKTKMDRNGNKKLNGKDEEAFESRHHRISFKKYLEEVKNSEIDVLDDGDDDLDNPYENQDYSRYIK